METKEILKNLVSYNTIRDKENKEIMDYIENYLKKFNFTIQRIDKCLIAYNDANPNIGFIGHTDTVDYESWDGDPFTLYEEETRLRGLGACDMKGGVASILKAISDIDLQKNKIALYFTNDEEIDMNGIKKIKDMIIPKNIIIGEPTNNIPVYGTKGILELQISFFGKKCHSSTPDKGINAIYLCIDFINKMRDYYENTLKKETCYDFEIPHTTMNIGLINGGETVNSVPGKCTIPMDFRIAIPNQGEKILNKVKKLLKEYNHELIVKQALNPNINHSDISFIEKLACKKETKCYLTEGSYIDKNFIILGPGPDTSHQKNEYIEIAELEKTVNLYKEIIKYYNKNK